MRYWPMLALVAGCVLPSRDMAEAAGPRGGVMVFARLADSLFLDPVLNDSNTDIWVLTNLYDTLILPADDGRALLPGLATSWRASPDGRTFTLELRQGARFSDGSPITAEDVAWSLDRARDPTRGIWNSLLESIASVEIRDPGAIVLTLKHPDPSLPAALATFNSAILPRHAFEATPGANDDERAKNFAEHPIGSGPFVLQSWQRGSAMTLTRNPHYWAIGQDGKALPYLDEVRFQIIPEDATRILKLRSGDIDAAEFIPYARVRELQADPLIDMRLFASTKVSYVALNARARLADGRDNPLGDVLVRQALNYAVDKAALIRIVTRGIGAPMRSYMASATPLFADQGPAYPYDLARARALLAQAGHVEPMSLTMTVLAGSADEVMVATALQQMWGRIGVKLTIEQVDNATLDARYHRANFQMRTASWTNDINDPNEITSYCDYYPNIENLHSGWDSKPSDALFERSQSETDPAARADEYRQIQETYMRAAPVIFLFETPYAVALSKRVEGFWQSPLGNNVFLRATVAR